MKMSWIVLLVSVLAGVGCSKSKKDAAPAGSGVMTAIGSAAASATPMPSAAHAGVMTAIGSAATAATAAMATKPPEAKANASE